MCSPGQADKNLGCALMSHRNNASSANGVLGRLTRTYQPEVVLVTTVQCSPDGSAFVMNCLYHVVQGMFWLGLACCMAAAAVGVQGSCALCLGLSPTHHICLRCQLVQCLQVIACLRLLRRRAGTGQRRLPAHGPLQPYCLIRTGAALITAAVQSSEYWCTMLKGLCGACIATP